MFGSVERAPQRVAQIGRCAQFALVAEYRQKLRGNAFLNEAPGMR